MVQDKIFQGVGWSGIEIWSQRLVSFAVFLVLARELGPDAFGLLSMAMVVISIGNILRDLGFRESILQKETLTQRYVSTAFWGVSAAGAMLTAICAVGAPLASSIYDEPSLTPLLRTLSLLFLVGAIGRVPQALLEREFDYRPLAIRSIVATMFGGATGIAMAVTGWGVWSLIIKQLVTTVVDTALLLIAAPTSYISLDVSLSDGKELAAFGSKIFGSELLTVVEKRGDDFLIGALLGASALGVYSIAYRVLKYTTTLLISVSHRVALPAFSKLRRNAERLRQGFYRANQYLSALAFPAFVGISVVAPDVVPVLFGEKWTASVPVLQWLALGGIFRVLFTFDTPLLVAIDRPQDKLSLAAVEAVTSLGAFLGAILIFESIVAVAIAYLVRLIVVWPIRYYAVHRQLLLTFGEYITQFKGATLSAAVMYIAVRFSTHLMSGSIAELRLSISILCGLLVYPAALFVIDREVFERLRGLVARYIPAVG